MALADSKIFRGDDTTSSWKEGGAGDLCNRRLQGWHRGPLVIHDGPGQLGLVRHALDNLTISGPNARRRSPHCRRERRQRRRNSERGLEYDTMSNGSRLI
jgi:hypothetical protein